MAVLVEAISVVVRRDAIAAKYPGGWQRFVTDVSTDTLCFDDDLARLGFIEPSDGQEFINALWQKGLEWIEVTAGKGTARDFVVVDQQQYALDPCDWLFFEKVAYGTGVETIAACRFVGEGSSAATLGRSAAAADIRIPAGWAYERSVSARYGRDPMASPPQRLRLVRRQGCLNAFIDEATGDEVISVRPAHQHRHIYGPGRPGRLSSHSTERHPSNGTRRRFSWALHISAAVAAALGGMLTYIVSGNGSATASSGFAAIAYFVYLPLFWYVSVWCGRVSRLLDARLW